MGGIYDIAIVGAGPAGAMLARELARRAPGFKVIIIDARTRENEKPCGGLLAPDAQKLLSSLDLTLPNAILADPQIFAVETIDLSARLVKYYQRHYLNMDRYAFDSWLFSLIPETVEKVSARCTSITRKDGAFALSILRHGEEITLNAYNVIGADGSASLVRRTFFYNGIHRYVSIQQHFVNNGQKLPYYSCIFDPDTSDSCSWTVHKDGYIIYGGAFRKVECRKSFEEQKAKFEAFMGTPFGYPAKTEACLVSSPRKMKDFVTGKDGVYLVGEAAGFISPSSFEGISSAMKSAVLLAQAFSDGKGGPNTASIYKRKTVPLKFKLYIKNIKRLIICTPFTRKVIMKSGIQSVKKL